MPRLGMLWQSRRNWLAAENAQKAYELRDRAERAGEVIHRGELPLRLSPAIWKRRNEAVSLGDRPIPEMIATAILGVIYASLGSI